MVDLRSSAARLIENPLVPIPPVEGVVARARRYRAARLRKQMGVCFVLVALALTAAARGHDALAPDAVRVVDDPKAREERNRVDAEPVAPEEPGTAYSWIGPVLPRVSDQLARPGDDSWSKLVSAAYCPEQVQVVRILLNQSPSSLDVKPAIRAADVAKRVLEEADKNVCADIVPVLTKDRTLDDLSAYTAVVGMPGDDALEEAIRDGSIARAGIPVIGGDGLTLTQHRSPWVFPVSPSAAAFVRIAVNHGWTMDGRSFALVYDGKHAWGREAKAAFDAYVDRIGGHRALTLPLDPDTLSYHSEADHFANICKDSLCDVVVLAVDQETARRWFLQNPVPPRIETSALPMLMGSQFAHDCSVLMETTCAGLKVWNPFNASLGPAMPGRDDGVSEYGKTVLYDPDPFTQAAYIAADVLVRALKSYSHVDPETVATFLRRVPYSSALVPMRTWASPAAREDNDVARLYHLRPGEHGYGWSTPGSVAWWRDPE